MSSKVPVDLTNSDRTVHAHGEKVKCTVNPTTGEKTYSKLSREEKATQLETYHDLICYNDTDFYCCLCMQLYKSGGSFTNAMKHLRINHFTHLTLKDQLAHSSKEPANVSRQLKTVEINSSSSSTTSTEGALVLGLKRQRQLYKPKSNSYDKFSQFFAHAPLPINFVTSSAFKTFIEAIAPGTRLPSRSTLSRNIDTFVEKEAKQYIHDILGAVDVNNLCITTDFSTGRNDCSYDVITLSYIDNEFIMHEKLMCVLVANEKHTADYIKKITFDSIQKFVKTVSDGDVTKDTTTDEMDVAGDVNDDNDAERCSLINARQILNASMHLLAVTVDQASNNVAAFGDLDHLYNVNIVICFAHRLHTLANSLDEAQPSRRTDLVDISANLKATIASVSTLMDYFSGNNTKNKRALEQAQLKR